MNLTLKDRLVAKINSIEEDEYLEAILNYVEESEKAPIYLTESDIESTVLSTIEIKSGQYLDANQLDKKVQKCLEE